MQKPKILTSRLAPEGTSPFWRLIFPGALALSFFAQHGQVMAAEKGKGFLQEGSSTEFTQDLDTGQAEFNLIDQVPKPAIPGAPLTFIGSVRNNDSEDWATGTVKLEVEIYDSKKKFVTRAKPKVRPFAIAMGLESQVNLDLNVPLTYAGTFYYRVRVLLKGEPILLTKPATLVIEKGKVADKGKDAKGKTPPPAKGAAKNKGRLITKGTLALMYTNNQKNSIGGAKQASDVTITHEDFQIKMKANLIARGTVPQKDFDDFAVKNFVGEVTTKTWRFRAGRFVPSFNEFTVNGAEMEAREASVKLGKVVVTGLFGRSVKANSRSKVYERFAQGVSATYQYKKIAKARLNYFHIEDKLASVAAAQRVGTKPIKGGVYSFDMDWKRGKHQARLGWGLSRVDGSQLVAGNTNNEEAIKYKHKIAFKKQSHEITINRIDANYIALANPGAKNASSIATVSNFKMKGANLTLRHGRSDNNKANIRNTNNVIKRQYNVALAISDKNLLSKLLPSLNYSGTLTRQDGFTKPAKMVDTHATSHSFASKWTLPRMWNLSGNLSLNRLDDESLTNKNSRGQRWNIVLNRGRGRYRPVFTFNESRNKVPSARASTRTNYMGMNLRMAHTAKFTQNLALSVNRSLTSARPASQTLMALNSRLALPKWKMGLSLTQNYSTQNTSTTKEKFTFTNIFSAEKKIDSLNSFFLDYKYTRKPSGTKPEPKSVLMLRLVRKF